MVELPDDVRDLFDGPNIGHVATVMADGAPHTVPVWVALEGSHVAFLTGPGSLKARNVQRDPRVAISVTDRDRPFVMGEIRGRVVQRLTGDRAWAVIDRISAKYTGSPYPRGEERVVFLVEPDYAWGLDFG